MLRKGASAIPPDPQPRRDLLWQGFFQHGKAEGYIPSSYKRHLVGGIPTPLKNMKVNGGRIIPYIMGE
jgi:hypothetical protein